MSFKTIDPTTIGTNELHQILLSAVAPRPIAFASTVDQEGKVNLSPFSFFNVFGSNPPTLIFSPSRKVRDNGLKHTLENVYEVREVVINIVNYAIVEQMSLSSTEYEKGVNEFVKAGFTPMPSIKIQPPRVKESPVSFECIVEQIIETGKEGGAGNLVICRVVMIHINEKYLNDEGNLETTKLDLVARMGGSWYCRASRESLFEIPKPLSTKGIGVDALSSSIRNSIILTGNNLGRLGNLEKLPSFEEIKEYKASKEFAQLKASESNVEKAFHKAAKLKIEQGKALEGLKILMSLE